MACPASSGLVDGQITDIYQGTHPLLSFPVSSDRDAAGMLNQTAVKAMVTSLKGNGTIPSTQASPTDYAAKAGVLLENAKSEYCFYESRYKYALDRLFASIRDGYKQTSITPTQKQNITTYLNHTQTLNQHLNDLIQLITAMTTDMMLVNSELDSEITGYAQTLQTQQSRLQEQKNTLASNQASMKLNKQMVQYTEEKSRYTDNLLKMYGVVNIVAVGLLVYLYKAAGDE